MEKIDGYTLVKGEGHGKTKEREVCTIGKRLLALELSTQLALTSLVSCMHLACVLRADNVPKKRQGHRAPRCPWR